MRSRAQASVRATATLVAPARGRARAHRWPAARAKVRATRANEARQAPRADLDEEVPATLEISDVMI